MWFKLAPLCCCLTLQQRQSFGFRSPHPLIHSSAGGRLPSHSETPLACTNPDLHTLGMNQRTASSALGCVPSLNPADFMRKAVAFKAASFCKEAPLASTEQQHPAESLQPLQSRCRLQVSMAGLLLQSRSWLNRMLSHLFRRQQIR